MARYLALLRGINVGGKNLIRMAALKECFEANGFSDVTTYIQSGNVLFGSKPAPAAELTRRLEAMLADAFGYPASVVLRTKAQMNAVVSKAPDGYGTRPSDYRYDVLFLKPPLTARTALPQVPVKDGVDEVVAGPGVLYASRLEARVAQSHINRIPSLPVYRQMTLRNWNTTVKLRDLIDPR